MRQLVAASVVISCLVGAALAQDAPTDSRFMPAWDERPSARDFANNYPDSAIREGVPGIVHLCCTPREDRRLDCRIGFEWPENRRFGQASLRVAEKFRLNPESYAAFQADPNAWMQVPIQWRVSPAPRNLDEIAQRVSEGTRGLCAPPGADPGPAPEPIRVDAH